MIVRVEAAVFGPAAGHTFELLDVVHLCALQRHALVFEPGARGAAERWCTSLGDVVGRLLSDELDLARRHGAKAAQRGRMRTELRLDGGAQDHWDGAPPVLSVRTAWAYLHLPLRVIVENVRSDGAFVAAMLHGDDGEFLRAAMADGRLAFAHGGGLGDVRRFVEALVDDPGARMRAVVLFDHDGFVPAKRSGPSSALKAFCEEHAIDHHALQRRAIENYIPLKALRRWCEDQSLNRQPAVERRIGALGKLPAEVRWHFNMKLGLCGDMSEALPAPFDKISGELFEPLAQGFGDRLAIQVFANPLRPVVDKWKYDDGSAAELQEIANTLMARL